MVIFNGFSQFQWFLPMVSPKKRLLPMVSPNDLQRAVFGEAYLRRAQAQGLQVEWSYG